MRNFRVVICLMLVLVILSSCGGTKNSVSDGNSSIQENNNPMPPIMYFWNYVHFDDFEHLTQAYSEQGASALINPVAGLTPDDVQIEKRKNEISAAFPGFTYIPCYNGSLPLFEKGVTVTVDSANSAFFKYAVAFDTLNDDCENYAFVCVLHGKDAKESVLNNWVSEPDKPWKEQLQSIEANEGTLRCVIQNNVTYFFDYDESTLIIITFRIAEVGGYESYIGDISGEIENGDWLSKLSFKRIDFNQELKSE